MAVVSRVVGDVERAAIEEVNSVGPFWGMVENGVLVFGGTHHCW